MRWGPAANPATRISSVIRERSAVIGGSFRIAGRSLVAAHPKNTLNHPLSLYPPLLRRSRSVQHMISVKAVVALGHRHLRPKVCTTNPVGMTQCAETCQARFSAHADRLHARLHGRRPAGNGSAA